MNNIPDYEQEMYKATHDEDGRDLRPCRLCETGVKHRHDEKEGDD